jgi:MFS family permease
VTVLAGLYGAADAFFWPAHQAMVPELVPAEDLLQANSLANISRSVAVIAGPLLGAALVAAGGTPGAFAFDALSFVISAGCVAVIQVGLGGTRPAAESSVWSELAEGFRTVFASTWLWFGIALYSLILAVTQGLMAVVLPQLVREQLGGGVEVLGFLQSAVSAGLVAGMVIIGQMGMPRRRGVWFYLSSATRGLGLAGLGIVASLTLGLALAVAIGISLGFLIAIWETSLQELVEPHLRGRVNSIDVLGSFSLAPIGYAAIGLVAQAVGPRPVFLVGGLIVAGLSASGLLVPSIRRFGRTAPALSPSPSDTD